MRGLSAPRIRYCLLRMVIHLWHSSSSCFCYRPQRSCGQGNIFAGNMLSSCSRGGGSASVHAGIPPPGEVHPPGKHRAPPPGSTAPREAHTPLGSTPPCPGSTPPPRSRLRHTVNERPVCILLECTLVLFCFCD